MIVLDKSLQSWGADDFRSTFRHELEMLDTTQFPLQQGLSQSSYVSDSSFRVMVINEREGKGSIIVKAGVFYKGIIAGCSCADDPTPVDEISEYCELEVVIDKASAIASISLVVDEGT